MDCDRDPDGETVLINASDISSVRAPLGHETPPIDGSVKSSRKTKRTTGVHCPGNKTGVEPDMRAMVEELRPTTPVLPDVELVVAKDMGFSGEGLVMEDDGGGSKPGST